MPLTAGAVISVIGAGAKTIQGISQISEAKKLQRNNKRPVFSIQDEYFNNQGLAQSMAQTGLSQRALNYYTTETQRDLTAGVDATLQAGGGANTIVAQINNTQRRQQEIAARDAEEQRNNFRFLIDQNNALAAEKTKAWTLNDFQPYQIKANAAAQELNAGIQNAFGGVGEAGGTLAAYSTAKLNQDTLQKMLTQAPGQDVMANLSHMPTTATQPQTPLPAPQNIPVTQIQRNNRIQGPIHPDMSDLEMFNLLYQ